MTDLRQAAQQALEALTNYSDAQCSIKGRNAITDLKAALEQPEQALEALERTDKYDFWREQRYGITALRTALAQPEPEPVDGTREVFERWAKSLPNYMDLSRFANSYSDCNVDYAWAGWQAALAQPEQEPVGWEHHEYRPYGGPGQIRIHAILASQYMMPDGSVSSSFQWLVDEYKKDKNTIKLIPLYATPPQRQWVGLTDAEIQELRTSFATRPAIRAIEAKLKERNT